MRQQEEQGAGAILGDFVAAAAWPDVAAQSHEAKRSILNFFATAVGSAYDPAVTSALRTLAPFSGAATSAIIGRPERFDAHDDLIELRRVFLLIRHEVPQKDASRQGNQP